MERENFDLFSIIYFATGGKKDFNWTDELISITVGLAKTIKTSERKKEQQSFVAINIDFDFDMNSILRLKLEEFHEGQSAVSFMF